MRFEGLNYESPNSFTFKQRVQLAVYPSALVWVFNALFRTNTVESPDSVAELRERYPKAIIVMWHETCGLMGALFRGTNFHTLTSYSFDGELAARIVRRFGIEAVRGSSSRGGFDAINQLERALDHVPYVGITADGPRGPRRKSKPGAALLGARTGLPIVPIAVAAEPGWRLNSWDRFKVPKPFGTVRLAYGEAIAPPEDGGRESVAAVCARIDAGLNALHEGLGDPA